MNFENHLFISYTHIDNQHYSGIPKGWIDHFHERLEIRLTQLLGKKAKVWRDLRLSGSDLFDHTINIELDHTAILVSVLSPRYLLSEACGSELKTFLQKPDLRVGDKHRIFKVVKTFIERDQHPPELRELLGYDFYHVDQASGRIREFDHEISPNGERDKRYWDKFEDLVYDIQKLLHVMEDQETPLPSGSTIFLAETTDDLTEERDKIKRELQRHGHTILPDRQLPLNAPLFKQTVSEYLKQCRLSIHLIGETYGIIPDLETERSIVRLQEELAIERGDDAGFSRLIWMPPNLKPKDARQEKFIVELQNTFNSMNGSELLQTEFEVLKTIIQDKLTKKPEVPVVPSPPSGITRIYLIHDQQDEEAVEPLRNHLFDQGYEAITPLFDGSEGEGLKNHKDNLLLCDAVLIFQGKASNGWVTTNLSELRKLPGYGRTVPLLGKGIYISAPQTPQKDRYRTNEATVIKDYGDFNESSIAAFLDSIQQTKGRLK